MLVHSTIMEICERWYPHSLQPVSFFFFIFSVLRGRTPTKGVSSSQKRILRKRGHIHFSGGFGNPFCRGPFLQHGEGRGRKARRGLWPAQVLVAAAAAKTSPGLTCRWSDIPFPCRYKPGTSGTMQNISKHRHNRLRSVPRQT